MALILLREQPTALHCDVKRVSCFADCACTTFVGARIRGQAIMKTVRVRRNDALGALFLGETLGKESCLHPTPVPVLVANYFIGYLGCMLDVLCGTASYRFNSDMINVEAGDYAWLRAFCPQCCTATGNGLFRYLLYKDVNRHMNLQLV